VVDGPFAGTKGMIGGYFILDVTDLDAAHEWAARERRVDRQSFGRSGPQLLDDAHRVAAA
jgi:hypothetical protein